MPARAYPRFEPQPLFGREPPIYTSPTQVHHHHHHIYESSSSRTPPGATGARGTVGVSQSRPRDAEAEAAMERFGIHHSPLVRPRRKRIYTSTTSSIGVRGTSPDRTTISIHQQRPLPPKIKSEHAASLSRPLVSSSTRSNGGTSNSGLDPQEGGGGRTTQTMEDILDAFSASSAEILDTSRGAATSSTVSSRNSQSELLPPILTKKKRIAASYSALAAEGSASDPRSSIPEDLLSPRPGPSGLQRQRPSVTKPDLSTLNILSAPDLQLDCLSSDTEDSSPEEDVTVVKISRRRKKKSSALKRPQSVVEVDLTQEVSGDDEQPQGRRRAHEDDDEIQVEVINRSGTASSHHRHHLEGESAPSGSGHYSLGGGIKLRRFATAPQGLLPPNVQSNSSRGSTPSTTPAPSSDTSGTAVGSFPSYLGDNPDAPVPRVGFLSYHQQAIEQYQQQQQHLHHQRPEGSGSLGFEQRSRATHYANYHGGHNVLCMDPGCNGECLESADVPPAPLPPPPEYGSSNLSYLAYRPRRLRHPDFFGFDPNGQIVDGHPPPVAGIVPGQPRPVPHAPVGCQDAHCQRHVSRNSMMCPRRRCRRETDHASANHGEGSLSAGGTSTLAGGHAAARCTDAHCRGSNEESPASVTGTPTVELINPLVPDNADTAPPPDEPRPGPSGVQRQHQQRILEDQEDPLGPAQQAGVDPEAADHSDANLERVLGGGQQRLINAVLRMQYVPTRRSQHQRQRLYTCQQRRAEMMRRWNGQNVSSTRAAAQNPQQQHFDPLVDGRRTIPPPEPQPGPSHHQHRHHHHHSGNRPPRSLADALPHASRSNHHSIPPAHMSHPFNIPCHPLGLPHPSARGHHHLHHHQPPPPPPVVNPMMSLQGSSGYHYNPHHFPGAHGHHIAPNHTPHRQQPYLLTSAFRYSEAQLRIMEQGRTMWNTNRGASKGCIERNTFPHKFKKIARALEEPEEDENNVEKCTICLCGKKLKKIYIYIYLQYLLEKKNSTLV